MDETSDWSMQNQQTKRRKFDLLIINELSHHVTVHWKV